MSFIEELKATVLQAADKVDAMSIGLSGISEEMDETIQLYATDLADSGNDNARDFAATMNKARQDLEALIASLREAEEKARAYLGDLG